MPAPPTLSPSELAAITDPAALLEHARALEPSLRLEDRAAALDRIEQLLEDPSAPRAPEGRDWRLEMLAERALDAVKLVDLASAESLSDQVIEEARPSQEIARFRALTARAQVLAWKVTENSVWQSGQLFAQLIDQARDLGFREWQGYLQLWCAYNLFFRYGRLAEAVTMGQESLITLDAASPWRTTALNFYADTLIAFGELDDVPALLDESVALADRDGDTKSRAYAAWARARITAVQNDALATERLLREVERDGGDWFATATGVTFLSEAAEMLDRLGLTEQAQEYLARAFARDPNDEFVHLAQATLLARSGDPWQGLEALQQLTRGDWLEKRLVWRHTLLSAWATFRAGGGTGGALAARAFEQAISTGGMRVAEAGEADIVRALAPAAAGAGSAPARALLLDGRPFMVRLFGTPSVVRADGEAVTLPVGKPGELVRLLALHEHGLPVDVVLEQFFPAASASTARHRLRQVLLRLRGAADDLVLREEDHLRLAPAWIDVREFLALSDRMRGTPGSRAIRLGYAALAVMEGPLLPTDRYAEWANALREDVEYRHLTILDRIATDAAKRGSHQEALTALDAIRNLGYAETEHYATVKQHLLALGRVGTANYVDERSDTG